LLPVTPLLRISATSRRFRGAARLVALERTGLFLPKVSFGRVQKQIVEDLFTLNLPLNGQPLDCRISGRLQTLQSGSAYFAGPGHEVDLRIGEAAGTLALNIDAQLLRANWLGPEDGGPSGEPCAISLDNPSGRALFRAVSTAWGELIEGESMTATLSHFEDEIVAALAQSLAPDLGDRQTVSNAPPTLSRAKAFIQAHLGDRLTVPDVAGAAGVSNRTLHRLFLQEEKLTPMQFVTQEPLNAVRRVLLASDLHEMTVTQAALEHGFAHLGRFSQLYRKAFGVRPSTTLMG